MPVTALPKPPYYVVTFSSQRTDVEGMDALLDQGGYDQAPRRAAPAPRPMAAPAPRPAPAPVAQAPRAASGFDDKDDDIQF